MISCPEITEDQLAQHWTLSERDIVFILSHARGDFHTLRYAIQLCQLRETGRFAQPQTLIALKAVNYLAKQLDLTPCLEVPDLTLQNADYARLGNIQEHLGFTSFTDEAKVTLKQWLTTQVQESVWDQQELTQQTKLFLKQKRMVLPSPSSLGRFIANAIQKAHAELYQSIVNLYAQDQLLPAHVN